VDNGNSWTNTITGKLTWHWQVKNGEILFTAGGGQGSQTLRENGAYNNSVPLSLEPGAAPYTCSVKSMHIDFPNGSYEMFREGPA
jgi:hypothetical protein